VGETAGTSRQEESLRRAITKCEETTTNVDVVVVVVTLDKSRESYRIHVNVHARRDHAMPVGPVGSGERSISN